MEKIAIHDSKGARRIVVDGLTRILNLREMFTSNQAARKWNDKNRIF